MGSRTLSPSFFTALWSSLAGFLTLSEHSHLKIATYCLAAQDHRGTHNDIHNVYYTLVLSLISALIFSVDVRDDLHISGALCNANFELANIEFWSSSPSAVFFLFILCPEHRSANEYQNFGPRRSRR